MFMPKIEVPQLIGIKKKLNFIMQTIQLLNPKVISLLKHHHLSHFT